MGIERAVVKATIAGTLEIRNMYTAQIVEVGGDTSAVLWSAYMNDLIANECDFLVDVVHFYEYEVYELNSGQWYLIDTEELDATGQSSAEQMLNAAAIVLIGKGSGLRHIGRKFLGAISEAVAYGNNIAAAFLPSVALALASYITPLTGIGGGTLTPGIVTSAGVFHPFVGGVVSTLLGTMRRRKPGVGT